MKVIAVVFFTLFSVGVLASNQAFDEFKKKIEGQKSPQQRSELLVIANELLASESLDELQTAFVLHRAGLICIREACFDKTEQYLAKLEQLLTTFESLEYSGKLNLSRGNMAITRGDHFDAVDYLIQAATYFDEAQLFTLSSHANRFLSHAYQKLNKYSDAIIALDAALSAALKSENVQLEMAAARQKSGLYTSLDLVEKSLEIQIQQIQKIPYLPKQAQEFWMNDTFWGLAESYASLGDYQKSIDYFSKVYEKDKKLSGKQDIAITLRRMGEQHVSLGQFEQASVYFQESIDILTELNIPLAVIGTQIEQANMYLRQGMLDQAQNVLESILSQLDQEKNINLFVRASYLLIDVYLQREMFDRAVQQLQLIEGSKNKEAQQYYGFLSQALQGLGDFENAFAAQNQMHLAYKNQMQEQGSIKTLVLASESEYIAGQYELKQAKAEQALLKAEQALTRYIGFSVVAILLLVILAVLIFTRQRRARLEQEAKHLNQALELKKQLLADVSHELRTPLAVLKLHLEALEHNLVSDPQSTYKVLNQRLDNLNLLISDIYELAQADTGTLTLQLESVPADELFNELAGQVEDILCEHDLHLEVKKVDTPLSELSVDKARLHQVIANLSRNSIHYTDKPGEVCFALSQTESDVILSFSDSSPGVSEQDLPHLFERLFRCDKSRSRDLGGSGLGLSICEKVIEAHGGRISAAQSELGGLKIEISLPKQ
jgi:signal transduction histidine kinase